MAKQETDIKTKLAVIAVVGTIAGTIIGILISGLGFNHWYKKQKKSVTTTVVTRVDTVTHHFNVLYPTHVSEVVIEHDTIYIDTNRIVNDYFTERDYCIDFNDDSSSATLNATVSMNQLVSSALDIRCIGRTTTITNDIETFVQTTPLWGVGVGAGVSYFIPYKRVGIDISVCLDYKRNSFFVHCDFVTRNAGIGYRYKVWQSKR